MVEVVVSAIAVVVVYAPQYIVVVGVDVGIVDVAAVQYAMEYFLDA